MSLVLGDEWETGCPKSPMWESGDGAWSEDESVSSDGSREGNVKISFFLKGWELAKVSLCCHKMHEVW